MSYLILTLTINPAIDHNVTTDRLVFEDRAYILATDELAGGRGINASRVIHSFGGKTLAILTSGGSSGARLEGLLKQYGFPVRVPVISMRSPLTAAACWAYAPSAAIIASANCVATTHDFAKRGCTVYV